MAKIQIEETTGYQIAMSFKPFIDPKCSGHMDIVRSMAKAINSAIGDNPQKDILITKLASLGICSNFSHHQINALVSEAQSIKL